ncbi:MAG TPA: hypothetical protein VJV05_11850 [Pyrinomonadaceae bacterium]|nr:hypothetical protein [Pyrinomonadaceae bacterium]
MENRNRKDLIRRVDRALDFAEAAISLVQEKDPGIDMEALEAPPDKIIAETAMLLRAVVTLNGDEADSLRRRASSLASRLAKHARHDRVRIGVALFPALALDYGAAHIVLESAGVPDVSFTQTIKNSLEATTANARERFPHRELEQAWLTSLLYASGVDRGIAARTSLIRGIDVISGSRDDAYSFTHALMYATDFGHRLPQSWLPSERILSIARSALAAVLDDDDFDLAGELLLSWPFLRAEWDDTASFAFAVLASVEDEVGVLPSLALDLNEYKKLPSESRKNYVAAVAYHTAYVMGLLCASALRAGEYPRKQVISDTERTDFADELIGVLRREPRTPQWLRYFETLEASQRNASLPLLLDLALRRALRKTNFAEAHELISEAANRGVEPTRLCVQGAEMLNRLARAVRTEAVHCTA